MSVIWTKSGDSHFPAPDDSVPVTAERSSTELAI